eukprot:CAMPEP_0172749154 /NCGR_PEP_ID=MMETSP1074-20121228/146676_1 /TAXON_ID=2916 /ORGANISM="Ceratium fusus, Strain PA161109" /LENGTH=54 /DNA_ID=CAMNT_0013581047 /DNA_START=189 /DNA_END=349 /DNA_ORIENTATION=+
MIDAERMDQTMIIRAMRNLETILRTKLTSAGMHAFSQTISSGKGAQRTVTGLPL